MSKLKQAFKGQWVQIRNTVLNPEERAAQLPDDTKLVPVVMWVKGNLNHDAELGGECEITTASGRMVKGTLWQIEPSYSYGFGEYVDELNVIRKQLKSALGV